MHILITGAAGFLGQLLAETLLQSGEHTLLLSDIIEPPVPARALNKDKVRTVKADLISESSNVISSDLDAIYIFHGIMSAGSESNFELGTLVNIDSTRSVLEALRRLNKPDLRVIYASSQAVYGRPLPEVVTEKTFPTPEGSYGAEKLVCETLINDYTRRGYFDAYILRFPTITVRPGKPSAAASSYLSGIIREPMNKEECIVPIKDRKFASWVCSPKTLAGNLLHALTLPSDALPSHIRVCNMPGLSVTNQEMIDALEKVEGKEALKYVKEEEDPALVKILKSWANVFDNSLAYKLGYKADTSFEQAVRDYKESLQHQ